MTRWLCTAFLLAGAAACDGSALPTNSTYGLACGVDSTCSGDTVCYAGTCILPDDVPPDGGVIGDAGN